MVYFYNFVLTMRQIFIKISSLLMAFVVLFSTMSFTISMHYCCDTLVETAIFHKAKDCAMKMEKPSAENCSITKKNCCDDEQLIQNGQDELQLSVSKISFQQQIFIASFIHTYINLFVGTDKNISSFEAYKPPLVVKDIHVLDEVYLI